MKNIKKMPKFESVAEEAAFWDSHDAIDFIDDAEPIEPLHVSSDLTSILKVPLDSITHSQLDAEARSAGMGAGSLAKTWILERLSTQARSNATTRS